MKVEDLMDHEIAEIRKAFKYFDYENVGKIKTIYLGDCLRWLKLVPSEAEIEAFIDAADPRNKGRVDFETFVAVAAQLWVADLQKREGQSWNAFLCFDKEDRGVLSQDLMKEILLEITEEPITEKEANAILRKFVNKKSGNIEYGYIIRAWQK